MNNPHCDLSIVIPILNNGGDMDAVIHQIRSTLDSFSIIYEVMVSGYELDENLHRVAKQNHCTSVDSTTDNYGDILFAGIYHSAGNYVITVDADQMHPAAFLRQLWAARESADIVIASRYIPGGAAQMPRLRRILSSALNQIFSRGLDLTIRDMSSGMRLYKNHVIKNLPTESRDLDILQEILVRALMAGYKIGEIPFKYQSSEPAYTRMTRFGTAYLRTFSRLWKLRNSIASADYDARAYNAMMPPQRYWQRQRYKHITGMLKGKGKCLDVGCGSSRIIGALSQGSIALDILIRKLRYARRFERAFVQGSIFDLPVPDQSFPCVLCSQVIEHVPRANVLDELDRVLQPGGFLILGTPDYAKWQWNVIEWLYKVILPQAYADEHITHYTFKELYEELVIKRGYELETTRYILQGELILGLRKPLAQ